MNLACEMESLIADRAASARTAYLDAVARAAAGEELDAADVLGVLEAVGVSPATFEADVDRQRRRIAAEKIVADKGDWQSALAAAEAEQLEIRLRHSEELDELTARHAEEMAGVRVRIQDAQQALADVAAAEKLLIDTEGVSALPPHPYRPIFGVVTRVDEGRGFASIESKQTPTLGNELYTKFGQLPGIGLSPSLIGQRVELEWFEGEHGRLLRAVRVVDEAPALAG